MLNTSTLRTVHQGFVYRCPDDGPPQSTTGSRCVVTDGGDFLCSFVTNSGLGINDFKPMLSRSGDGGRTWSAPTPIWPKLHDACSIMCSISRSRTGELFLFGSRTPIDTPGELFWSPETLGAKQNDLVWSRSTDEGITWSLPQPIALPLAGAAEAPAPMCVTRSGRWIAPYTPYPTLDPNLKVDRSHVVAMISDDQGGTWHHRSMLSFSQENPAAGEAWVIELSDGRLLGTCWQINLDEGDDWPNPFAISEDGGDTWSATCSSSIMGQSTALEPLPDGRALFVHNQRVHDTPGVWLAVVNPTQDDFGIETHQIAWRAESATQGESSGRYDQWDDFAFGEPSITVLPDETLMVTLWCQQASGTGIRFVRLERS